MDGMDIPLCLISSGGVIVCISYGIAHAQNNCIHLGCKKHMVL